MAYDVFISYRRLSNGVNGVHIARSLQQELRSLGLNVFFDMEELTDGKFNEKLYGAIEESKNVIFLMTEGSLDRCVEDGDWVRRELEHVLEKGVNLIPVAPTGTTIAFPAGFPATLEPMKVLEISELNLEKLFRESVAKIAGRLKDVVLVSDKEKLEAEEAFLVQARAFKGNDGVIDAEEMKQLAATAKELGISKAKQIKLIAKVEQEYVPAAATGLDLMPPMPEVVPSFDVFISYRRNEGASDARLMYERLTKDGYSVSYDMDTLKSGNFNEELLRRIAECRNFVVLLSKGCFDRTLKGCRREDDWLRIELATALYNKKNVVAVMLPGFEFPAKLPPDIDDVRHKNGPKYDLYYIDSFYEKLKGEFLVKDNAAGQRSTEEEQGDILSVDATVKEHDDSLDDIFGDDAGYWREEAEPAYRAVSRVLPYQELKKLDDAWNSAEENFKGGDHKVSTRRYMDVIEIAQKVKGCSSPFVTRMVGDGVDTKSPGWFDAALAKAQQGDRDYQYGVGTLYSSGLGVEKDISAAFRWFERAAAQGHVQALAAVGAAYATGEGVEIDYRAARKYLTRAEKKGNVHALERLGYLYQNGYGVRRNYAIAVSKYKAAATNGNSAAMVALGMMLESGVGVAADMDKAISWYRAAVSNGSAAAQRKMAQFLFAGKAVEKDEVEAVKLARLAANQGDADAIAILGRAYENGSGIAADAAKAEELYRKSVEGGSALGRVYLTELESEAQYRNGVRCLEGTDGEQDFVAAKQWFEKAAGQGNARAMEQLGLILERGLGCPVDVLSAKSWYEKAESLGDVAAKVGLGRLFFRGYDGIDENYKKAGEYFKAAAAMWRTVDRENQWKVLRAFFYLGRIYTEGLDVEKDCALGQRCFMLGARNDDIGCAHLLAGAYEKGSRGFPKNGSRAEYWYRQCVRMVEAGKVNFADDLSVYTVGLLYYFGDGFKKDVEKGVEWFKRGSLVGNVQSSWRVARAYRTGTGVPKNQDMAIEYYTIAAERGDAASQNSLSWMYYTGEGVGVDYTKALEWGVKAARNGSAGAMETLWRMYRDGSGVEKDEAEAVKWLRAAADKGNGAALAALGDCHEQGGFGVEQDMVKAVELYRKAADKENVRGMYCLARCYRDGHGVEQDEGKAWQLIVNCKRDDGLHFDDKAIVVLAEMYYGGDGFSANEKRFNGYDRELDIKALRKLGFRYKAGKGLEMNIERSVECLTAAAELGDKTAQNSLGWMYYKGELVERDVDKAFEWTKKAVDNGNPYGMETLFRMYRDGDGVARNEAEALRWLEAAYRNPDGEGGLASSELGECYEKGLLGRDVDVVKAFGLYYESSQRSKCPGKYNRGRCHLYGIGTDVDVGRAVEWLTKAAEKEDGDDHRYDLLAMDLLARMYGEGIGVGKDEAKSRSWTEKRDELKAKRQKEIRGFVSPV